ncbi:MAG: hypothetical protein KatS3mg110_1956 [Pirellulaceae bacterium]|nr:MAG: hypothetical protein KatS3mg110_1956 [Pirellulaceae bacterium]
MAGNTTNPACRQCPNALLESLLIYYQHILQELPLRSKLSILHAKHCYHSVAGISKYVSQG